jgi:hypothetical protein
MKKINCLAGFLVVSVLVLSAFIPSQVVVSDATPIPDETKTPSDVKDGFSGNWIAYSVIPLKPGSTNRLKPGIRVKVTSESYSVDDVICQDPKYSIKTITKTDFLKGNALPNTSLDFYEDQFPYLTTGCNGLEPAALALVSYHSLAGLVDGELIFFEPDSGVSVGGMDVTTDLVSESSEQPLYEMHGQAPVIQGPNAEKLNILLKKAITDELDGFKKNFIDWEIPPEMAKYVSFMWIGYDVPLLTPQMASFRFHVDYYMAGAAHPNHYFKVVNYDLEHGKTGEIKDLFNEPAKAFEFLSKFCKTDLGKPDFPLFEEGLEPKEENFKNWNLTEKGLRLSFDPYQVAPYAAGPQEVLIPFSELRSLVKKTDAFGAFIAQN